MKHPFTDEELIQIFEIAYIAMKDSRFFDAALDQMDLADEVGEALREKFTAFMDEDFQ